MAKKRIHFAGRPKGSGGTPRVLTPEEIQAVDRALVGTRCEHRDRCLFFLGLGTGLRIHELCALLIQDVAPAGHVLEEIQLGRARTKSRRPRNVVIAPQARYFLDDWLRRLPPQRRKLAYPVFPGRFDPDVGLSVDQAKRVVKKIFARAGVFGASSHSLRRTHAQALRRQGVDLKIIQAQLGHSTLAVTERYFELDPVEANRAISQLRF